MRLSDLWRRHGFFLLGGALILLVLWVSIALGERL